MVRQVYLFLLPLCLLLACAAKRSAPPPQADAQPLLLFQKTPCYGTCPAYNATIYSDGRIRYEGLRYAPVQDTLYLQLEKKQLEELQQKVNKLSYNTFKSSYLSPYTDMPSTYITFYEQGREGKRVKHQQGGPEALQQLLKQLDTWVMEHVKQASGK